MKKFSFKRKICLCLVITFFMTSINIITAYANFNSDDQATIYTVQARLRELGYFNYRPTATFGEMTKAVLNTYRIKNGLGSSSVIDETSYNALFSSSSLRKDILSSISLPIGPQTSNTATEGGDTTSFSEVANIFKVGDTITMQDFITGKTISVKRTGGENHVVAVLTGDSTVNDLKAIFGNTFTWEKRGAVAIINGQRIAAAMSVFQDGSNISLVIFFTGSASDISGTLDVEYAEKISQAVK